MFIMKAHYMNLSFTQMPMNNFSQIKINASLIAKKRYSMAVIYDSRVKKLY